LPTFRTTDAYADRASNAEATRRGNIGAHRNTGASPE
jgi:hypothetical protein